MVVRARGFSLAVNSEKASGLCCSDEDAPKILQGDPRVWDNFLLFTFSESRFFDDWWICWNPQDQRHIQAGRSSRIINWKAHFLPEQMLEELKRLTWTKFVVTGAIPSTISQAETTLRFMSQLVSDIQSRGLHLNSFSELEVEDIEAALASTKQSRNMVESCVRPFFIFMTQTPVFQHVGIEIKWNTGDINNLPWKHYNKKDYERGPRKPLSSELFLYRSNLNRALVRDFLEVLGEEPEDTDPNPQYEEWRAQGELLSQRYPNPDVFTLVFQAYIDTANTKNPGNAFRIHAGNKKAFPKKAERMERGLMGKFFRRARWAAIQSIGIYTGMRQSELKGIRQPLNSTAQERSIRRENGMWFLYSTVTKGIPDGAPVGTHRWVAPTVIRDAVRVLELQQPLQGNPYLISGFDSNSNKDRPLEFPAKAVFEGVIKQHFAGTKWEDEMANWTHHTDRHTLVKELDAAGVQLVHISRQLQHTHMMLAEAEGSEITFGYGGIGKRSVERVDTNPGLVDDLAQYRDQVKRERYHAVLGEDAVLAGPGGIDLKFKIDAKFQGMGYEGAERKDYIDQLVDAGFPLPTSGFGICGQPAFELEDEPPCMGDYECDPNCKSCIVIPERTYQAINEFRRAINMLHSVEQEHNWSYWKEREDVFGKILDQLGENPAKIKEKYLVERKAV